MRVGLIRVSQQYMVEAAHVIDSLTSRVLARRFNFQMLTHDILCEAPYFEDVDLDESTPPPLYKIVAHRKDDHCYYVVCAC